VTERFREARLARQVEAFTLIADGYGAMAGFNEGPLEPAGLRGICGLGLAFIAAEAAPTGLERARGVIGI
jgi:hypothetical protein